MISSFNHDFLRMPPGDQIPVNYNAELPLGFRVITTAKMPRSTTLLQR